MHTPQNEPDKSRQIPEPSGEPKKASSPAASIQDNRVSTAAQQKLQQNINASGPVQQMMAYQRMPQARAQQQAGLAQRKTAETALQLHNIPVRAVVQRAIRLPDISTLRNGAEIAALAARYNAEYDEAILTRLVEMAIAYKPTGAEKPALQNLIKALDEEAGNRKVVTDMVKLPVHMNDADIETMKENCALTTMGAVMGMAGSAVKRHIKRNGPAGDQQSAFFVDKYENSGRSDEGKRELPAPGAPRGKDTISLQINGMVQTVVELLELRGMGARVLGTAQNYVLMSKEQGMAAMRAYPTGTKFLVYLKKTSPVERVEDEPEQSHWVYADRYGSQVFFYDFQVGRVDAQIRGGLAAFISQGGGASSRRGSFGGGGVADIDALNDTVPERFRHAPSKKPASPPAANDSPVAMGAPLSHMHASIDGPSATAASGSGSGSAMGAGSLLMPMHLPAASADSSPRLAPVPFPLAAGSPLARKAPPSPLAAPTAASGSGSGSVMGAGPVMGMGSLMIPKDLPVASADSSPELRPASAPDSPIAAHTPPSPFAPPVAASGSGSGSGMGAGPVMGMGSLMIPKDLPLVSADSSPELQPASAPDSPTAAQAPPSPLAASGSGSATGAGAVTGMGSLSVPKNLPIASADSRPGLGPVPFSLSAGLPGPKQAPASPLAAPTAAASGAGTASGGSFSLLPPTAGLLKIPGSLPLVTSAAAAAAAGYSARRSAAPDSPPMTAFSLMSGMGPMRMAPAPAAAAGSAGEGAAPRIGAPREIPIVRETQQPDPTFAARIPKYDPRGGATTYTDFNQMFFIAVVPYIDNRQKLMAALEALARG